MFILTHPVNFPVGGNRSARREPTTFGRVLTNSFHVSGALGLGNIEKVLSENRTRNLRGERRAERPLRHRSPHCTHVHVHWPMHYRLNYIIMHRLVWRRLLPERIKTGNEVAVPLQVHFSVSKSPRLSFRAETI